MTQMRTHLFAMVTTKASHAYTAPALSSFISNTRYRDGDTFILIDNDNACSSGNDIALPQRGAVVRNSSPKGFAANMNAAIEEATIRGADLIFLNNDLIFTDRWVEPLVALPHAIVSPLSNRELNYATESFKTAVVMSLEEYTGHEQELARIVADHQKKFTGALRVTTVPFFAIRIPYEILMSVGYADESFGKGGGEDYDYCLRAILAGHTVAYAQASFLLHFGGKSSYSGAETKDEQSAREKKFFSRFEEKWGEALFRLCLREDLSVITGNPELSMLIQEGDYRGAIQKLCRNPIPSIQVPRTS